MVSVGGGTVAPTTVGAAKTISAVHAATHARNARRTTGLPTNETWLSLFEKCGHCFGGVFGAEVECLCGAFVFQCLLERDVGRIVEHALRLRKRNGWACGKALGPVGNERINVGIRHHAINKTNALGFLRTNDLGK